MLELKLKVYHKGEGKTLSMKKTDTLGELIRVAMVEHGVEGRVVEDVRLR